LRSLLRKLEGLHQTGSTSTSTSNRAIREGRISAAPAISPDPARANEIPVAREVFGFDLTAGVDAMVRTDRTIEALEARFGLITSWLLMRRAIVLTPEDRVRLLEQVDLASTDAAKALKRMSMGDYTPDPAAERFPVFMEGGRDSVSLWKLFDAWAAERDRSTSAQSGYRKALREFVTHVGHEDAIRINPRDVVAWKDSMLAEGRLNRRTIADVKLAALKSILGLAAKNHRIPSNPAKGITVEYRIGPGERMKGHTDDAARRILAAALEQTRPALRWVPWIMSMTGGRIGEACCVRGRDVHQEDGVWVVDFASKTAAGERSVPLHPTLISRGFIEFAQSRGDGYLFFEERRVRKGALAKPGKSVANDVREWIKGLGLEVGMAHRVAPGHGFRHLFATMARKVGMDSEKREAMMGHELAGERGTYGTMAGLAAEIAKLPDPLGPR
jgi:integrase